MEISETAAPGFDVVQLMTIPDVVKQSRFGRSVIYQEINAGRLRAIKRGRSVRVRTDDYQLWIDELSRQQARAA